MGIVWRPAKRIKKGKVKIHTMFISKEYIVSRHTIEFLKCFSKVFFWFFWWSNKACSYRSWKGKLSLASRRTSLIKKAFCKHHLLCIKSSKWKANFTLRQRPKTIDVLLIKLLSNNLEPWKSKIKSYLDHYPVEEKVSWHGSMITAIQYN